MTYLDPKGEGDKSMSGNCARRAGQSIQVLFRYYAKFLAEARHHANRLIEDSMRRWDEHEDAAGDALARAWPGNAL